MTRSVTFVDLAGFTALTQAHGDETAVGLLTRFLDILIQSLGPGDRLVKTIGDGALLVSDTPEDAAGLAEGLVTALTNEDGFPDVRVGVNTGPVVERDGDVFGNTVNVAARLVGLARRGEILAARPVADAARYGGLHVESLGRTELRGVSEPFDLYRIDVATDRGESVVDPVCHMRVDPRMAAGEMRHDGRTHWFCSLGCAGAFAADPDNYVGR